MVANADGWATTPLTCMLTAPPTVLTIIDVDPSGCGRRVNLRSLILTAAPALLTAAAACGSARPALISTASAPQRVGPRGSLGAIPLARPPGCLLLAWSAWRPDHNIWTQHLPGSRSTTGQAG
jgi:hypothetical protein